MIIMERREKILSYLEKKRTATVRELAGVLYISEASVRRDLEALEKAGQVRRIYGGVVLEKFHNAVVPLGFRESEHSQIKEELARRAAEMIGDGDTVMLDASSTVRRMIKYLGGKRGIKIITNNLRIFSDELPSDVQLYCTGGLFNAQNALFFGAGAERYLRSINADKCFFSSQGISEDGRISDASEEETALRRVMLSRAERKIFLCDGSKLGIKRMFTLCGREDVDEIICNVKLPWEENQ
ncbi:MAG: DeoR/GlpR transcriptional regulator [Clostridia bacterium]|nr:DeoR/GlpR transcriptional regulator [Clostridia bacterium]